MVIKELNNGLTIVFFILNVGVINSKTLKQLWPTLPISISTRIGTACSRTAGANYAQTQLVINNSEFYSYNNAGSATANLTYGVIIIGF